MKDKEIINMLNDIEQKFPVNEWIILQRHVWPYIKMVICNRLATEANIVHYCGTSALNGMIKKLYQQMSKIVCAFTVKEKIGNHENADVLIMHHNGARNILLDDGKCFDRNLDPFTVILEPQYKVLSLEYLAGSNHKNTFSSVHFIDNYIDKILVTSRLQNILSIRKNYSLKGYDEFLSGLPNLLKEDLSIDNLIKNITYINNLSCFFKKIICKNGIKFVIAGCGYGEDTMALFMACNDAGVKCMEVQHGLAGGAGHRWYTSWKKLRSNGKKYEMLPDIYWCWSEHDKHTIDSWGKGCHIAFHGYKPIYCVLDLLKEKTKKHTLFLNNGKKNILFSLQPEVEYPIWIKSVMQKTSSKCNWLIRKHPRFDQKQASFINNIDDLENVYVNTIDDILLEKLLLQIDLHITNHSAVAIDVIDFNIKTIILGKSFESLFSREIQKGMIQVATDENTMITLIDSMMRQKENACMKQNEILDKAKNFLLRQI